MSLQLRHISHHYQQSLQRFEISEAVQELDVAVPHQAKVRRAGSIFQPCALAVCLLFMCGVT